MLILRPINFCCWSRTSFGCQYLLGIDAKAKIEKRLKMANSTEEQVAEQ